MLKSLYWKLAFAFALIAFLTAVLVAVFIRLTSADRLSQFIIDQQRSNLEVALQEYYQDRGSWTGVDRNWRSIQFRTLPTSEASGDDRPPERFRPPRDGERDNLLGLADANGNVLIQVNPRYPVGARLPADVLKDGTQVIVDGKAVGTILTNPQSLGFNPQEALFLRRTTQALFFAAFGAMLGSLALGIVLARGLTGPLKELTEAAQNITQGKLEQTVSVQSNDEIGQLAVAFNRMSQEVARVNHLRRQMTADIAHDLRTPLTVISGYIEAMQEGVLKPTPERLSLIYFEIQRLQNLVGDLRTLSMADSGELALNPQPVEPQALLQRAAELFTLQAQSQGVALEVEAEPNLPLIQVDEARMQQVLDNLITNALRYTASGGQIRLQAVPVGQGVELRVKDSGVGIALEDLENIFDRFYRAEKSRHTDTNESGLGLAIVKAFVEAQQGQVWAESTLGQGATFFIRFEAA